MPETMSYERFFSYAAAGMRESAIRKMGTLGARIPDLISFAPGYPDPATFPWDALREAAGDLLSGDDRGALQYGATRGYRPLLEALEPLLAGRGIASHFDERLVTSGSQQGLDLIARVLIDPGDVVLVELPTYTGAISAFVNARASLLGVRQEDDGIDLDQLDGAVTRARAEGRRVRLLYVVPNFQNPTGLLIGLEKRRRLLAWAEQADVLIVEDDPYGDLFFPDSAAAADTRPLKADDAAGRVVYLSSFSKTLAPGLRTAWVVAPEPITQKFDVAKQAADICTGSLDQRLVHRALAAGLLAAQGDRLRAHYQRKRVVMERAIGAWGRARAGWPRPRGGFFLWLTLPQAVDADRLLQRALGMSVSFVTGRAFFVDGSGHNTVRLSFSQPSEAAIEEGIARLGRALEEEVNAQGPAGASSADNGISVPSG
jgi:2-aminoadipate transaminase